MYLNITENNQTKKKKNPYLKIKVNLEFYILLTNKGSHTIKIKLQIVQVRCVCYITING